MWIDLLKMDTWAAIEHGGVLTAVLYAGRQIFSSKMASLYVKYASGDMCCLIWRRWEYRVRTGSIG
jgi:hypothetical protein